ncbi:MAG TPA: endonuclease/exonuclease/phosphatase family protein, partial [Cyclobacteriaceae bacterium]|nr:endonuclease/exonuclease/phosphatase family protein [Cyclobacteriaceae bacterium]
MKKNIYILVAIISLCCYSTIFIPPDFLWVAGFVTYSIPFIIIFNFLLFIFDLKNFRITSLIPLIILVVGWGFINDSFQYPEKKEEGPVKVLTYNVRIFNFYNRETWAKQSPAIMADWIRNTESDIICLQEFFTTPAHPNLNTLNIINKDHEYQAYNAPVVTRKDGAQFGSVIFTRYPILQTGKVKFANSTWNQAIYADVLISGDTLRIYNLHLQSYHIDEKMIMDNEGDLQEEVTGLYSLLRTGFIRRAVQIRAVNKHIRACRHRVLVCGDLNDLPYSYTYYQLKRILRNSFSTAGRGFGFTF